MQSTFTHQGLRSPLLRRSLRKPYPVAVRGEGVYLWDADGKRYLDFSASAAMNFIGHGVREIADVMVEQSRQVEFVHSSQFTTPVAEEFAAELLDFASGHFRGGAAAFYKWRIGGDRGCVETCPAVSGGNRPGQAASGSEPQPELSRIYTGCARVSGNRKRREIYLPMVREFAHIGMPYCYRCDFDCADGCRNCGQQYAVELITRSKQRTAKPPRSFLSL